MEKYVSVVGAGAAGYGASYADAIKSVVNDGKNHSILLMSGAACYGATSFIEGTAGSLKALQDVYGLKYTKDIKELATTKTQMIRESRLQSSQVWQILLQQFHLYYRQVTMTY